MPLPNSALEIVAILLFHENFGGFEVQNIQFCHVIQAILPRTPQNWAEHEISTES